jgi:hypothetical protein
MRVGTSNPQEQAMIRFVGSLQPAQAIEKGTHNSRVPDRYPDAQ